MNLRDAGSGKILWQSDEDLSIPGKVHEGEISNRCIDIISIESISTIIVKLLPLQRAISNIPILSFCSALLMAMFHIWLLGFIYDLWSRQ